MSITDRRCVDARGRCARPMASARAIRAVCHRRARPCADQCELPLYVGIGRNLCEPAAVFCELSFRCATGLVFFRCSAACPTGAYFSKALRPQTAAGLQRRPGTCCSRGAPGGFPPNRPFFRGGDGAPWLVQVIRCFSTMLRRMITYLAAWCFIELAPSASMSMIDSPSNEAFAVAVATPGVRNWLRAAGDCGGLGAMRPARSAALSSWPGAPNPDELSWVYQEPVLVRTKRAQRQPQ